MKKNGKFLFEKGKNSDILNHINCSELRRFVSKIVGYAILTKYEAFWKLDLNRTQDEQRGKMIWQALGNMKI